jgi:peptidoglycan/LPS O-acetylase OafA/YrhL
MPHGYLAVDFFFVLSGLVIAHAYLGRLQTSMTATGFVVQRLIRLWPMLVPGTLFGAAMEFWRPNAGEPVTHFIEVVVAAVLGSMALPWPFSTSMEQTIFPINGPVWSLFFEIVANLVFVAVATARFSRFLIRGLVVASAAGLLGAAVAAGTVDVGPLLGNWPGGLPRVLVSFFIGVLLSSYRHRIPATRPWVFPIVLLGLFMVPAGTGAFDTGLDVVVVLFVLPLIVASASHCTPRGRWSRVCDIAGDTSYPLYAIHYPIVRAICFVFNRYDVPVIPRVGVCVAAIVAISGLSWVVFQVYDRPFRRFLTRRLVTGRGGEMSERRFGGAALRMVPPLPEVE